MKHFLFILKIGNSRTVENILPEKSHYLWKSNTLVRSDSKKKCYITILIIIIILKIFYLHFNFQTFSYNSLILKSCLFLSNRRFKSCNKDILCFIRIFEIIYVSLLEVFKKIILPCFLISYISEPRSEF